MATVTDISLQHTSPAQQDVDTQFASNSSLTTSVDLVDDVSQNQPPSTVLTTIYGFPKMEPIRFAYYPTEYLNMPFRKDLLHRAVIYEGDMTRQGTASTKWRDDVQGSGRKLYRQKGTGKARVGDKKSPIRRGGGVAFGPHPRDFATGLPKRVYDMAFRTALSFRYRKGELLIVDKMRNVDTTASYWIKQIFEANGWGNANGRSFLVAKNQTSRNKKLFEAVGKVGEHGKIQAVEDVDVKDLLSMGRLIIEYDALNDMLLQHSKDLMPPMQTSSLLQSQGQAALQ